MHEAAGFTLLAAMQGNEDDEDALHKLLDAHLWRREGYNHKDLFKAHPDIYRLVDTLMNRQIAAPNWDQAETLPRVPFSVIRDAFQNPISYVSKDGQASFLEMLPPPERVAFNSSVGYLNSESDEWFTPSHIIDAARKAMGSIDTDPASCFEANQTVQATYWYDRQSNGLLDQLPWQGNVWLNPPYGRGDYGAQGFTKRLLQEITLGTVTQAITCLNLGSMSAFWFEPIMLSAAVQLIYKGRLDFRPPDGKESGSPNKGTVFSYFGPHPDAFLKAFGPLGYAIWTHQRD